MLWLCTGDSLACCEVQSSLSSQVQWCQYNPQDPERTVERVASRNCRLALCLASRRQRGQALTLHPYSVDDLTLCCVLFEPAKDRLISHAFRSIISADWNITSQCIRDFRDWFTTTHGIATDSEAPLPIGLMLSISFVLSFTMSKSAFKRRFWYKFSNSKIDANQLRWLNWTEASSVWSMRYTRTVWSVWLVWHHPAPPLALNTSIQSNLLISWRSRQRRPALNCQSHREQWSQNSHLTPESRIESWNGS